MRTGPVSAVPPPMRANNSGEVPNRLRGQIIVLHEALDAAHMGAVGIAHALCDLDLRIERQPFFGATSPVVQVAARRVEKIGCLAEPAPLTFGQNAKLHQILNVTNRIVMLGDPV